MDDLISRQAAVDALKKAYWDKDLQAAKDDPCVIDAMTDWAIRQIKDIPSAERRGKKKVYYHGENTFSYVCDQCAMPVDGNDEFCRWCGAKMEV